MRGDLSLMWEGNHRPRSKPPSDRSVAADCVVAHTGEPAARPSWKTRPQTPAELPPSHHPRIETRPPYRASSWRRIRAGTTQVWMQNPSVPRPNSTMASRRQSLRGIGMSRAPASPTAEGHPRPSDPRSRGDRLAVVCHDSDLAEIQG